MPEVSCYSMDLYCDHDSENHTHKEFPHNYIGKSNSSCKRQAKKEGWRWHSNGGLSCPKCSEKGQPKNVGFNG